MFSYLQSCLELAPSREKSKLSGKESNHSSASGRKSRNLREAYHHLREEALRRYRLNHEGDDPPEDWEPSLEEQDDIIRALSPRNDEADPELLQAQADGAFKNIGTPRATPDLQRPGSGYISPSEQARSNSRTENVKSRNSAKDQSKIHDPKAALRQQGGSCLQNSCTTRCRSV